MTETKTNNIKPTYYNKKNDLVIIQKYQDLITYVYMILNRYPKDELLSLVADTKKNLFLGLEALIFAKKTYNKKEKLKFIIIVSSKLEAVTILVRIAKKNKYIKPRNYTAWSYKINEILEMLEKWEHACRY